MVCSFLGRILGGLRLLVLLQALLFPALAYCGNSLLSSNAKHAIVYDLDSNTVLYGKSHMEATAPASMTKVMTLYLAMQYAKSGSISLQDKFLISKEASQVTGTSMYLKAGQLVSLEDLLRGMMVDSGNDAAVAIAEGILGDESSFVNMMNLTANRLGLTGTHYENVSGLQAKGHKTTMLDLVKLGSRLIKDFPEIYKLCSIKYFTFNGVRKKNANRLLFQNLGVDGIKTGHTQECGYGILLSAVKDGRRIILAINGLSSDVERAKEARKLLLGAFNNYSNATLWKKDSKIDKVPVRGGNGKFVPFSTNTDVVVSYPNGEEKDISVSVDMDEFLIAPVKKGQKVGELKVKVKNVSNGEKSFPVFSTEDVAQLSFFGKLLRILHLN